MQWVPGQFVQQNETLFHIEQQQQKHQNKAKQTKEEKEEREKEEEKERKKKKKENLHCKKFTQLKIHIGMNNYIREIMQKTKQQVNFVKHQKPERKYKQRNKM